MRRGLISVGIFLAFVAVVTLSRHLATSSSTTTTSTTTTTAASGSTTTTTATTVQCAGADFRGAYNEGEGAAGTIYASVTLTKTTPGPCTENGWPTLTLQDHYGAVLPSSTVDVPSSSATESFVDSRANQPPSAHAVVSGATLTFSLAYSDVPTGTETCPSATTLSVAFRTGGSTVAVTPQVAPAPCDHGTVWVSPLY
ncbi:MAG TPA: DUF4232 domain-containing protein [Acidimicrobiales bacterium]|nr:DUF4232 domain-containing protein [Acidimicrobiales bacterium]